MHNSNTPTIAIDIDSVNRVNSSPLSTQRIRRSLRAFLFLLALLAVVSASAQESFSVSGTVYNPRDQQPLPGATTMALSLVDSSMIAGTTTDPQGFFTLNNLPSGKYLLKVSYIGHKPMYRQFEVEGRSLGLGQMLLKERSMQLKAVEVVAERAEMKQQGDTTVYFADAVSVGHGATAGKLLEKMSGMRAQGGVIQAQGEDVVEILVDGQRFFEGDLETALKMLPAESVKNVEVYDFQSDQSKMSGIDDGSGGKAINIVTKQGYEQSVFGRGFAGIGGNGEYHAGGNVNLKSGTDRLSLLYQSNNINRPGFAEEDVSGINGSQSSPMDGISQVHAGGIDFASQMGEQSEVSGTYLFRRTANDAQTSLLRQYVPDDNGSLDYSELGDNQSTDFTHDLQLRVNNQVDEYNQVLFQPRLFISTRRANSYMTAQSATDSELLNATQSSFADFGKSSDFSAPISFAHRFYKKGRTLSIDATPSYNKGYGENELFSRSHAYGNTIASSDSINQEGLLSTLTYRLQGGVRYTEPISKSSTLSVNYRATAIHTETDDQVFKGFSEANERNLPDSLLSNQFQSDNAQHEIEPEYIFRKGGHFLKVGIGYNWSLLQVRQQFPHDQATVRKFEALLPGLTWRWRMNKANSLRLNYRTSFRPPSAFQLQTVPNNTNPLRQYAGNENLKQEYRHSASLNYTGINLEKGSVFLIGANFNSIENFFGTVITTAANDTLINGRIALQQGGQLVRTENLSGFLMAGVYTSYDHELDFIKSNFSIGLNLNFSRMPGMINGENNWTKMPDARINLGLTSNISDRIDFEIHTSSGYETAFYTLQPEFNNRIFKQDTRAGLQWMAWKGLEINIDARHQLLRGQDENFDTSILLCNAALGYKFLKNKQAEFRLTVFDLFNNNDNIRRTISDLYTDTYRSNVLNRYVMFSVVYRLNSVGNRD